MSLARQSTPHDAAQALTGIDFPADKNKIVEYARSHNAKEELVEALKLLPDEEYTSMADVFKGIGMSHASGAVSEQGSQHSQGEQQSSETK